MVWIDEYQKFVNRMNTPRVVIDNEVCSTATLVKVDSARKHGSLVEAVQAITDLNLSIKKAYISSDGRWFMDVFHVTDHLGRKLNDDSVLAYIEDSICAGEADQSAPLHVAASITALELTGNDRAGLLSDIFAVLSDQRCSVVDAKLWTHNSRIASIVYIADEETGSPIHETDRIHRIESRLRNVVKGNACSASATGIAHAERRLHQMMMVDLDHKRASSSSSSRCSTVSVENWIERGYSVVSIQCKDRPKLLFDVVCTLTDMKYVVFHGSIHTDGHQANHEFYIRHSDGSPISSGADRQRVILCLEAAIDRRSSEGLRFEMSAPDRKGLLAEVSRSLRENGLSVAMAEVSIIHGIAVGAFDVTDAAGHPADPKIIHSVIQRVGADCLKLVTEQRRPGVCKSQASAGAVVAGSGGIGLFYLGSIMRRNLYNLGFIRSCS